MKNLLSLIIKEKKIVLTCVISALIIFVFYFVFMYKPLYSSSAKLFIKDIPQESIIAQIGGTSVVKSESGYSNPLFNLAQVLKSRNTSTKVLDALKINQEKDLRKISVKNEDEWHNYFSNNLKTSIIPSTDTLSLSLKWPSKDTTGTTLNEIINQFTAENMQMRRAVAVSQRKYLEQNLQEISNKLTNVRQQIRNYTIAHNAVNMDVEKAVLVQARVEMEKDIETTKSRINYYDKKYRELSDQIGMKDVKTALRSASAGQDPYLGHLFNNLAVSQQKYATLNSTFTDNYPGVIAAKNEVKTLKDVIKQRQTQAFANLNVKQEEERPVYDESSQEVIKEMAMSKAEKVSLVNQLREMQRGVGNLLKKESTLPERILGLEELQKQESALKAAYENVKIRQLESKIQENSIVNNIFVLDSPSKPAFVLNDLLFKFMGFLYLGVIAGIAAAWIKDYVENRIKDDEMESFAV